MEIMVTQGCHLITMNGIVGHYSVLQAYAGAGTIWT